MEYIRLGQSDLMVSRIGLGTWAIGETDWGRYDEKASLKTIEAAISCGVNFIDTAPVYGRGKAETLVGEAIRGKRDRIVLTTKCGLSFAPKPSPDLSPGFIEQDLSGSLKRLGTEYIDLYLCHWPDPKTPLEETAAALQEFQRQGKIRYIGLSNFTPEDILKFSTTAKVTAVQAHYSLLERKAEEHLLKTCRDCGIPVLSYGSLGGGVLTGKYAESPKFCRRDPRAYFYRFHREQNWPAAKALADGLVRMGKDRGRTPATLALAWLLSRPGVAAALVGARTPGQMMENIKAVDTRLAGVDIETLTAFSDELFGVPRHFR